MSDDNGQHPPDEYLGHVEEEYEEVDPSTLDPELARDLWSYDNPQAFFNLSLPQTYNLRVYSKYLNGDDPNVLHIGVRGDNLPMAIAEGFLQSFNVPGALEAVECESFEQFRSETLADPEFRDKVYQMRDFYVRHFPKMALRLYEIWLTVTILYGFRNTIEAENAEEVSSREASTRAVLEQQIAALHEETKRLLALRGKGRPPKMAPKIAPPLAYDVWTIACRLQGDNRGKGSAPGFSAVALEYDPTITENALRQRLIRAMWPWERIRDDVEARP